MVSSKKKLNQDLNGLNTIDSFIGELDKYQHWNNENRIKMSLG